MDYTHIAGANPSRLGYGCMRFPVDKETKKIKEDEAMALLDQAIAGGVTYFDTGWMYHNYASEEFMGRAMQRYPRDSFYFATKMPCWEVKSLEHAKEIFAKQLEHMRTDYFDFYLFHNLTRESWEKMHRLGIYELLVQYHEEGKIRRLGFSFHDNVEVFKEILDYRDWDFCQIQLNYMDTRHQAGLAGLAYAHSKGVPVVIMEPAKGGSLAQLSGEVVEKLTELDPDATMASWAMRWVGSQPGVAVVLSGMSTPEQVADNVNTFSDFKPLDEKEAAAVQATADLLRSRLKNGCTSCKYCIPCPFGVDISTCFTIWNSMSVYRNPKLTHVAWKALKPENRPDRCVKCGKCEKVCPQQLPIREHLAQITAEVEAFIAR